MKVFISYSTGDLALVQQLGEYVGRQAEVFYWDKANVPGQESGPPSLSGSTSAIWFLQLLPTQPFHVLWQSVKRLEELRPNLNPSYLWLLLTFLLLH